jgi:hypothetical protein
LRMNFFFHFKTPRFLFSAPNDKPIVLGSSYGIFGENLRAWNF